MSDNKETVHIIYRGIAGKVTVDLGGRPRTAVRAAVLNEMRAVMRDIDLLVACGIDRFIAEVLT